MGDTQRTDPQPARFGGQTLALVAIVKNEAETFRRCLESVRPLISHWTICDTGSTDGTQDIIRDVLAGIPGKLFDLPFINFGHNRSEAFVAARGTADWLLASDADMVWTIDPDFEPDHANDAYMLEMGSHTDFSYRLPLLLRGDLPWKSVGAVHEYTALPDRAYVSAPTDAIRVDMGTVDRSSPEKSRWHATLLEADLERDSANPRTTFYLAQTYRELGDPRALEMYRRRATMGGWVEEAFYAAYRAALLEPDWPTRMEALLRAWEMRPTRLEPLHALVSELNRRDMHHAAYRLSEGLTGPCTDNLFVHRSVWDWGMAFERSIAAWWVGDHAEAAALNAALLANPRLPDAERAAVLRNATYIRAA